MGGGIFTEPGELEVDNTVLWHNSAGSGSVENQQFDFLFIPPSIDHSCVEGWSGSLGGTGNIGTDPQFADAAGADGTAGTEDDDLRLLPASPCIDAGENAAVPADVAADLDGHPRFLEIPEAPDCQQAPGTCGDAYVVDMGAYEALGGGCLAISNLETTCHGDGSSFTVTVEGLTACTGGTTQVSVTGSGGAVGSEMCFTALVDDGGFCCSTQICFTVPDCTLAAPPCDLNGDGAVGMADFLGLLGAWGACTDCSACPADFDGDCAVGVTDVLELMASWTP